MSPKLTADGHTVKQAVSDADTLIVESVLEIASEGKSVTVFCNDTDVIVMLLHHWHENLGKILVRSDIPRKGYKARKQLDVGEAALLLKPDVKKLLPFIHAFGGCDTTSGVYDKGKLSILRLIEKSEEAQQIARIFSNPKVSAEEIGNIGTKVFVLLYGGSTNDSLPMLRYRGYMKMISSSGKLAPNKLPPTERSAYFHSLRV